MWCLMYLERESPTALVSVLKDKSFDVHIALDVDDLLDTLWYHGSAVGRIVIETAASDGLKPFFEALKDWPDLDVLVFDPTDRSIGHATHKHRVERTYSLQRVSHWLGGSPPGHIDGGRPEA